MTQNKHGGKALGAIVALSLGALLFVACAHERVQVATQGPTPINPTVTVKGEVDHPLGPGIFVFESHELQNEDTLVFYETPQAPVALNEGDDVRVTGSLQSMSLTELQQRYNITLPEDIVKRFDGKPVFLAQRIEVTDKD